MGPLGKFVLSLDRVCAFLSGISILVLTSIAAGNMLMRMVYKPIHGSYELIGFFGATSVGLALGYSQIRKDHIVVTIITERFSEKAKRILDRISYFLSTIFFLICGWQTFMWGFKLLKAGELSETLKIIYYPFVFLLSFGFFVLALTLIFDFINTFQRK